MPFLSWCFEQIWGMDTVMYDILKIGGLVLKEISGIIFNQFFWVIFLLLILLYKKSSNIENVMLGKKFPLLEKVSGSLVTGIIGGLIGSFLVIALGISLQDYTGSSQGLMTSGIMYIWLIAIALAMINPRYLCFSYAGGIIALMNLLTGFPNINVSGLLALIGILHLVESFLIRLDGFTYAVPLFLKKKDGTIVGGYMMNKMWPIPLVLLAFGFVFVQGSSVIDMRSMPEWWPIIKQAITESGIKSISYMPFLVPVVLGYGDMAITKTPEKRCKESSVRLALYSVVLIMLAVLASKNIAFAYAAAIFAPLAHELLIIYGKKEEEEGKPLFAFTGKGLTVLYSKKNSPAEIMKLQPGDVILSVNNTPIEDEVQLAGFLSKRPSVIWMEVRKVDNKTTTVEYSDYVNGIRGIGALVVPRNAAVYFEMNDSATPLKRLIKYFKGSKK